MRKYLFGFIFLVVVIIGILFLARFILGGPSTNNTPEQTAKQEEFSDKTTQVSLVTDGKIVALEDHRSIHIIVNELSRRLEVQKGYDGDIIETKQFDNTSEAYKQFLISLKSLGFTMEKSNVTDDERGECPSGYRYIYRATYNSGPPLKSWSSTCGGTGRMAGKSSEVQELFKDQIPNYDRLVATVRLSP